MFSVNWYETVICQLFWFLYIFYKYYVIHYKKFLEISLFVHFNHQSPDGAIKEQKSAMFHNNFVQFC